VNLLDKFSNEAYYRFFNALSNRTRLAIIDELREKSKTASEVAQALNEDPEVTSQYLELMAGCMLLEWEGLGPERRYSLNNEILEPLNEALSIHTTKYCPGLKRCTFENKLESKRQKLVKELKI
jgi:DNA-binding transcriptional ArsR family regulator